MRVVFVRNRATQAAVAGRQAQNPHYLPSGRTCDPPPAHPRAWWVHPDGTNDSFSQKTDTWSPWPHVASLSSSLSPCNHFFSSLCELSSIGWIVLCKNVLLSQRLQGQRYDKIRNVYCKLWTWCSAAHIVVLRANCMSNYGNDKFKCILNGQISNLESHLKSLSLWAADFNQRVS